MPRTAFRFPRLLRLGALALCLPLAMAATYLVWRDAPLLGAIEGQTLTWRFQTRGATAPPPEVAVIAIDDASMAELQHWPLPRIVLAAAIDKLRAAGAKAVGIDLLLPDPELPGDAFAPSAGDLALRDAMRRMPTVLPLAFTFEPDREMDLEGVRAVRQAAVSVLHHLVGPVPSLKATGVSMPHALLREAAGLGHVNVLADEDGVLRQIHLAIPVGGRYVPAFPVEIARQFRQLPKQEVAALLGRGLRLGERFAATDSHLHLPLLYYGPPKTIPTYPFADLLADRIPPSQLTGRAVLIGATAVGIGDTFVSPFSRNLPGVEALATAAANLIGGQMLQRGAAAIYWDLALILGFGLAAFAIAHLPSPLAPVAAVAILAALLIAVAQFAFETHLLWLSVTFPALAILANAVLAAASRVVLERRRRREAERQKSNLSRFHSPVIADTLAREGAAAAERRQLAAILFVDLAGFTSRSETLPPEAAARFLRDFHGRVEHAVLDCGGVLDQFLGDGAMVIFGLQNVRQADGDADETEAPVAALACARKLIADIETWSRQLIAEGLDPLVVRIGIHHGPVAISRLGGASHMQFSAAGDTVNVAARLEGLGRAASSTICASDAVIAAVKAAGRDDLLAGFKALPPQPIRGRRQKLGVWMLHHLPA